MDLKLIDEVAQRLEVDCRMGKIPRFDGGIDQKNFREMVPRLMDGSGVLVVREASEGRSVAYLIVDKSVVGGVSFQHV